MEKELLQFYMTQASQFTTPKLQWMMTIGDEKIKDGSALKSMLHD